MVVLLIYLNEFKRIVTKLLYILYYNVFIPCLLFGGTTIEPN